MQSPTATRADAPPRADRRTADHTYYAMTKSLCRCCKRAVDGKVLFRDGAVYLETFCPEHGSHEAMIASSVDWYLDCLTFRAPSRPPGGARRPVEKGCPFDCGPCGLHQQAVFLPVIPITSRCNLDCPICYTVNKNEDAYHLSRDGMATILENLRRDGRELDIINFTGGEPTMHPDLPGLLRMCRDAGIERLTVSTNGLRLLDEAYVEALAAVDTRVVLSFDTFRADTDRTLLGADTVRAKQKVLDLLERHDVATTILPAVVAGVNDDELGALFEMVRTRPNLVSLEVHPMCYTGQGGAGFAHRTRLTIPDVHRRLEEATGGRVTGRDFVPSPLAPPHCYSICYLLLLDDGGYVPYTRLLSRAQLYDLLSDSLYIEPRPKLEAVFRDLIDRLWADPDPLPESEAVLATLKRLLKRLFPTGGPPLSVAERRRIAERSTKAIYIHAHMDEETFDAGRVMGCPVAVPEPSGQVVPTCAYNVLYRERDPRFASAAVRARLAKLHGLSAPRGCEAASIGGAPNPAGEEAATCPTSTPASPRSPTASTSCSSSTARTGSASRSSGSTGRT